jgi:hypothetical protein
VQHVNAIMNGTRGTTSWAGRLLIALTLVLLGAAAAVWALARFDKAAQFLGVETVQKVPVAAVIAQPQLVTDKGSQLSAPRSPAANPPAVAELEARLAQVERTTQLAAGSAGRADALVVAFAARRAIDRGAPLGFLENLLVDRFGARNAKAVATVISASRAPVRLDQLVEDYEGLEPQLRGAGSESWWAGFRREMGSLVEIRRADMPSRKPETRYRRASERLSSGDVEGALAETMRLPGSKAASGWAVKARRYIAAQRALDELESAALMSAIPSR